MTKEEELFHQLAEEIPDTTKSKMFGALCLKAPNGKAGVMFWRNDMIFKPGPDNEEEAMNIRGAKVFTPMADRPMNGWIHIPASQSKTWKNLAELSMDFVSKIPKKPKPLPIKNRDLIPGLPLKRKNPKSPKN